jgi:hypothetical protein
LDQHVAVNNLGEISIEIWNVSMVAAASPLHTITFPEDQKVHERSKKALAHRVKCELSCLRLCDSADRLCRLGEDIFTPQQQRIRVKQTDVAPLVTFTFKYRSFGMLLAAVLMPSLTLLFFSDMLKANGIVPAAAGNKRSAATQSVAEDVKPEIIEIEDDAEEIKALEVSFRNHFWVSVVERNRRYCRLG